MQPGKAGAAHATGMRTLRIGGSAFALLLGWREQQGCAVRDLEKLEFWNSVWWIQLEVFCNLLEIRGGMPTFLCDGAFLPTPCNGGLIPFIESPSLGD